MKFSVSLSRSVQDCGGLRVLEGLASLCVFRFLEFIEVRFQVLLYCDFIVGFGGVWFFEDRDQQHVAVRGNVR